MKNTRSPFLLGTFLVASVAAVRCGGSSSASTDTGITTDGSASDDGAAGSSSTDDASAGTGGSGGALAAGGAAGNAGGTIHDGSTNQGGSGGGGGNAAKDGGTGGTMGAGGAQVSGDAGMCRATAPMSGSACEGNVACDYPMANDTRVCACRPTMGRLSDGGRERAWQCANEPLPRDSGMAPMDGGATMCPGGTNDGDRCQHQFELCREGRNKTCACIPSGPNLEWACN